MIIILVALFVTTPATPPVTAITAHPEPATATIPHMIAALSLVTETCAPCCGSQGQSALGCVRLPMPDGQHAVCHLPACQAKWLRCRMLFNRRRGADCRGTASWLLHPQAPSYS
jgi:hypothetical protein